MQGLYLYIIVFISDKWHCLIKSYCSWKQKFHIFEIIINRMHVQSLCEQIQSDVIQEKNGVKDMIVEYWKQKFHWARYGIRFINNRWTCAVISKRLETTTEKTSTTIGRQNCQAIQQQGEEQEIEMHNHQVMWKTLDGLANKERGKTMSYFKWWTPST